MKTVTVRRDDNFYSADWGEGRRRCAVGSGGIGTKRREGDGITPIGVWPVRRVFYRADKMNTPVCVFPPRPIVPDDGWCDAPDDANYNREVKLPYQASAENLWRDDSLYDIVAVLGFNDAPVIAGLGSAIFLHIASPDYAPTAGCIALSFQDACELLAALERGAVVKVEGT